MKNDDRHPDDQDWSDIFTLIDHHHGYALAYGLRVDDHCTKPVEYSVSWHPKPNWQVRGFRQDRLLRGKRIKPLPDEALKDELILLPGASMTPEEVILALQRFILQIQKHGLVIGKASNDLFCAERIGAEPRFVACEANNIPIEKS